MRVPGRRLIEIEGHSHDDTAEEYYSRENSSARKYKDHLIYIRMVQHLIEKCLLFHMDRPQCVHALAKHASIHPLVTLTVWKGLVRENKDFFRTYFLHMASQLSHGDRTGYDSHRCHPQRRSLPHVRSKHGKRLQRQLLVL